MPKAAILTAVSLLFFVCAGCDRPPRGTEGAGDGPPKVVSVDPDSPEGKALAAARQKEHENWVSEKRATSSAATENIEPAPDKKPMVPRHPDPRPGASTPPAVMPPVPATPQSAPASPSGGSKPEGANVPAEGTNRVTAASQTGRKANEYGPGLISTPIGAYFASKAIIAIKIQLESELRAYAAINGPPRNFDELNEKVIKPAKIKLPELHAGERYVFDPKQGPNGTLMIEQPAPQPK